MGFHKHYLCLLSIYKGNWNKIMLIIVKKSWWKNNDQLTSRLDINYLFKSYYSFRVIFLIKIVMWMIINKISIKILFTCNFFKMVCILFLLLVFLFGVRLWSYGFSRMDTIGLLERFLWTNWWLRIFLSLSFKVFVGFKILINLWLIFGLLSLPQLTGVLNLSFQFVMICVNSFIGFFFFTIMHCVI